MIRTPTGMPTVVTAPARNRDAQHRRREGDHQDEAVVDDEHDYGQGPGVPASFSDELLESRIIDDPGKPLLIHFLVLLLAQQPRLAKKAHTAPVAAALFGGDKSTSRVLGKGDVFPSIRGLNTADDDKRSRMLRRSKIPLVIAVLSSGLRQFDHWSGQRTRDFACRRSPPIDAPSRLPPRRSRSGRGPAARAQPTSKAGPMRRQAPSLQ